MSIGNNFIENRNVNEINSETNSPKSDCNGVAVIYLKIKTAANLHEFPDYNKLPTIQNRRQAAKELSKENRLIPATANQTHLEQRVQDVAENKGHLEKTKSNDTGNQIGGWFGDFRYGKSN